MPLVVAGSSPAACCSFLSHFSFYERRFHRGDHLTHSTRIGSRLISPTLSSMSQDFSHVLHSPRFMMLVQRLSIGAYTFTPPAWETFAVAMSSSKFSPYSSTLCTPAGSRASSPSLMFFRDLAPIQATAVIDTRVRMCSQPPLPVV